MVTSLWLHPVPMEQALDTQWLVLLLQSSGRDSSPIRKQRFFFFFISYPEKQKAPHPFLWQQRCSGFRPSCMSFAHPLPLVPRPGSVLACSFQRREQCSLKSHPARAGRRDLNKESDFPFFFFLNSILEMKTLPELAPGISPVTLQNRSSTDIAGISVVKA